MPVHPVTGKVLTNDEMAQVAAWEARHTKEFVPNNTVVLQSMNKSAEGLNKAKGAARPLEKRPQKPPRGEVYGNVTGKKLFRKTRKARKSRKYKK